MRAVLVALATLASLLVHAPAHADVVATVGAEPQQALGGCARYDFDYNLNLPPGTTGWQAKVFVYDSGQVNDLYYAVAHTLDSSGGDRPFGTLESQRICEWEGPVGSYAISIEGTYNSAAGTGAITGTGYMTLRPAKTRTWMTASTRSPRFNQPVRVTVTVQVKKEYGYGAVWAADVKTQIRAKGRWITAPKLALVTSRKGTDNFYLRWNIHQPVTLRFLLPKQDMYAKSVSKPITIDARG
jgi:hypothetical protein